MNTDETTIAIMRQNVSARHMVMVIDQLHFLPDNPRVYASIREMPDFTDLTPEEKQVRIYKHLLQEPSVKNLIPEIRRDGGLQDPIIVRHDTRQVIEGNSRLAVYRKLLEETGDERWTKIRCLVVSSLTDDQQTRLLGQTHLHGRTEWSPYAKALFCFRWVDEDGKDANTLSKLSGLSVAEINKNVKIIQLMKGNNDDKMSRFSYYNVLVRNRAISSAIEQSPALRNTLLSQIKGGDFKAREMRDHLPIVINKPKILRKFEKGDISLDEAFDRAKISDIEQRLKKVRGGLNDIERTDINVLEHNELKAVQQVVRQIRRDLRRVSDMIETKITAVNG